MLHLIINPTAGNGLAFRVGAQLVQFLLERKIPHTASVTKRAGEAIALARDAAAKGVDTVVAVGGDGTVSEVMRGLFGTNAALGIVPAGTGNDVIKMLGIPKKPLDAMELILDRPARPVDVGKVNDRLFMNICGTGFDVCVLDGTERAKKIVRGMLPYLWGVLRAIFTFRPVEVTCSVEGEKPFTRRLLMIAVANGRFLGGGMEIAPDASPDDGLFDLVTVDAMPNWKMPFCLPKLVGGRVREIPGVRFQRCRRVTLHSKGMRLNLDGEVEAFDDAAFTILPRSLRVHC